MKQYRIVARNGDVVANVFASKLLEEDGLWTLYARDAFIATIYKREATLILCPYQDPEAQVEARYPIIRAWSERAHSWSIRAGVTEAAGSVGR